MNPPGALAIWGWSAPLGGGDLSSAQRAVKVVGAATRVGGGFLNGQDWGIGGGHAGTASRSSTADSPSFRAMNASPDGCTLVVYEVPVEPSDRSKSCAFTSK